MICKICKRDLDETQFPLKETGRSTVCGDCLLRRARHRDGRSHYTEKQLARFVRDATGLKDSEICDVYNVSREFIGAARKYEI